MNFALCQREFHMYRHVRLGIVDQMPPHLSRGFSFGLTFSSRHTLNAPENAGICATVMVMTVAKEDHRIRRYGHSMHRRTTRRRLCRSPVAAFDTAIQRCVIDDGQPTPCGHGHRGSRRGDTPSTPDQPHAAHPNLSGTAALPPAPVSAVLRYP
jgi:hypothetical protein